MITYLDMPSGISGDIFLGCLVNAGWPVDALVDLVRKLDVPDDRWDIRAERVMRGALAATLVDVHVREETTHRHLPDVIAIIDAVALPEAVKTNARAVFTRLAQAEAAVHGIGVDEVHFHEVGALDAIIDVLGVCAGLDALEVTKLYAGSFPLGEGWTKSAHGRIPLPAPATLNLLAAAGAPTRPAPGPGELVTPTGAALVCTLAEFRQPPMQITRVGMGAGQKSFDWPNVARLWLGHASMPAEGSGATRLVQLETNIDDMSPELYQPVQAQLFAAGALDVWLTPVQMKKGRPGTLVGVLAAPADEAALTRILLHATTTLGVRVHDVRRHEAGRIQRVVETEFGPIRVKVKLLDGAEVGVKPEYEDCRQAAEAHGVLLQAVYAAVARS
jgi:uncharacterized protein (TIGR00299 family) protein